MTHGSYCFFFVKSVHHVCIHICTYIYKNTSVVYFRVRDKEWQEAVSNAKGLLHFFFLQISVLRNTVLHKGVRDKEREGAVPTANGPIKKSKRNLGNRPVKTTYTTKKRRESSKRNYFIISPRVIIKAIIIIHPRPLSFFVYHQSSRRKAQVSNISEFVIKNEKELFPQRMGSHKSPIKET